MKKIILLTLIVVAFIGCSKDEPDTKEEEIVNYLENTNWQGYIPIVSSEYMVKKYLAFKKGGICEYSDSITTNVSKKIYYYDPVNGEPINGVYYTTLYYNYAKTDKYETLIVQKDFKRIHYYWIMGDLASVIFYKRIN